MVSLIKNILEGKRPLIWPTFLMIFFLTIPKVFAASSLSYSGRLVNADGSPVTGSVNLKADLAYTNDTTVILCTQSFTGVSLTNGVFHLKLNLDCTPDTLEEVLQGIPTNESVAIRITDQTHAKVYSFQALHSMPLATMAGTAKALVQMNAVDGQVLTWDNGAWKPLAPATLAAGSVGTTELADGSVTDPKVATGISRGKLAAGNPSYVLVNDGSGLISETPQLSILQGGTGASTAAGAWTNLGIVIGTAAGQFMGADAVPSCAADEKLFMTLGPTYLWDCIPDGDATKLPLAGGQMTGAIDMFTNRIIDLGSPIDPGDAANKAYVDSEIAAVNASQWTTNGTSIHFDTGNVGLGTATPTQKLDVIGNIALSGKAMLQSDNANYVELKAPLALASTLSLTLPGTAGSAGYALITDGNGILSWSAVATTSTNLGGDLSGPISNAQIVAGAIVDADVSGTAAIAQSKIANLTSDLAAKEPTITGGTTGQYWRGDKTWQTLNSSIVPELTNLYFTEPRVLGTDLAGLSTTAGTVTATDTVLSSIGKLIGNVDAISASQANYVLKAGDTMSGALAMGSNPITGLAEPTTLSDAATKNYVDTQVATKTSSQWTTSGTDIYYNTGNVGIGVTAPVAKLDVFKSASNNLFKVHTSSLSGVTGSIAEISANSFDNLGSDPILLNLYTPIGNVPRGTILKAANSKRALEVNNSSTNFLSVISGGYTKFAPGGNNNEFALSRIGIEDSSWFDGNTPVVGEGVNINITGWGGTSPDYRTVYGLPVKIRAANSGAASYGFYADIAEGSKNWAFYAAAGDSYFNGNVGIGNNLPMEKLDVSGNIALTGKLRLKSDTANYVELKAPLSLASTLTFNLPGGYGTSGQALTTNGSGTLSWSDVATTATSVGGDLSGSIANAQIISGAVGSTEIADLSVSNVDIADTTVAYSKLNLIDGDIPQAKVNGLPTALAGKEPSITAGTTTQYWRGDKTWQTLDTSAVTEGTNLYFTQDRVRGTPLTGYGVGTAVPLAATDTVLQGLGKLEAQIIANDAAFDSTGHWSKSSSDIYFNTGNVGIGTTNPGSLLQVGSSTNRAIVDIHSSTSASSYLRFMNNLVGGNSWGLGAGVYGGVTSFDIFDVTGNKSVLTALPSGNIGIGSRSPSGKLHTEDTILNQTSCPAGYTMADYDSDLTADDCRAIGVVALASGNVGIGTTTPRTKLEINNGANSDAAILATSNEFNRLVVKSWDTQPSSVQTFGIVHNFNGDENNGFLKFWRGGSTSGGFLSLGTSGVERMTISSSGRVGVGTATPGSTLDIGGTSNSAFVQNLATWGLNARTQGLIVIPEGDVKDDGLGNLTFTQLIVMNPLAGSWIRVAGGTYTLGTWGSLWIPLPPTGARGTTVTPTVLAWTDSDRNYEGRDRLLLAQRNGAGSIWTRFGTPANYTGSAGAYFRGKLGVDTTSPREKIDIAGNGRMIFGPNSTWGANLIVGGNGWTGPDATVAATDGNLHLEARSGGYYTYINWYGATAGLRVGNGTSGGYGPIQASAFTVSSDLRLKENIQKLPDAISKITKIRGVTYKYKDERYNQDQQIGVIAQDVQKVYPEAVLVDEEGMLSVNYSSLVAPLIEAVKEQQEEIKKNKEMQNVMNGNLKDQGRSIASLETQVEELKAENRELKARLERIEKLLLK